MKNLNDFVNTGVRYVFTDIDDTLTEDGLLSPIAYSALWNLQAFGINVIPVTGRPAGWCELIARQWPVAGVIGENGGLYFRYANKTMKRYFAFETAARIDNNKRLEKIKGDILTQIPGAAVASDQFCRLMDLAIDYCEDVPRLTQNSVEQIVSIFKRHGAQAKISSIHVNGWFGDYDKLSTCKLFCEREFNFNLASHQNLIAFVGDSPNDEPMFHFFKNSFGVANVLNFKKIMSHLPAYVADSPGGLGFSEITNKLCQK